MKTKLTPELEEQIVKYLRAGNYINTACAAVGINKTTFFDWMNKGEAGKQPYANFANSIEKAQAEAIARNVVNIQTHAKKNWQASAWFLERKDNENWGRKDRLALEISKLTDEEIESRIAALENGEAETVDISEEGFSNN